MYCIVLCSVLQMASPRILQGWIAFSRSQLQAINWWVHTVLGNTPKELQIIQKKQELWRNEDKLDIVAPKELFLLEVSTHNHLK